MNTPRTRKPGAGRKPAGNTAITVRPLTETVAWLEKEAKREKTTAAKVAADILNFHAAIKT